MHTTWKTLKKFMLSEGSSELWKQNAHTTLYHVYRILKTEKKTITI